MAGTDELTIKINAKDNASSVLHGISGALSSTFGNVAAMATQGIVRGLGEVVGKLGDVLRSSVETAAGFEEQMAILSAAVGDPTVSLGDLHDIALQVGADTSLVGVSATEAADAMTGLYKAGLDTNDIFGDMQGYMAGTTELSGALRAAVDLQAASSLDLAGASDAVAIAMATFGLDASQATSISNSFVQTADASVAEVEDLVEAFKVFGPTAATFGFSLQDTNAALGILSTRGISGAEAGTSLKSMFTNIMRPTADVTAALGKLNIKLYDQAGNMKPLPAIVGDLSNRLSGLTEEQRNGYVQTLAGTYGMKALQTLISEGLPGWNAMSLAVSKASSAQEIAALRADTHKGKLEALKGTIETVKIGLGEAVLQGFTPLISTFADLISDHGPKLQEVFKIIGEVLGRWVNEFLPTLISYVENDLIPDLERWTSTLETEVIPALEDTADSIGDLLAFIKDTKEVTDRWEPTLRTLTTVFKSLTGDIVAMQGVLDMLHLPSWLHPGSPTPLETGLTGIRQEMALLTGKEIPALTKALGSMNLALTTGLKGTARLGGMYESGPGMGTLKPIGQTPGELWRETAERNRQPGWDIGWGPGTTVTVYGGLQLYDVQSKEDLLAQLQGMMP